MPNFKARELKKLLFPFEADGVSFLWKAENEKVILVFTCVEDEKFFLQVAKTKDEFIIKADKHSKISKTVSLQKALQCFKDNFCTKIVSESCSFKENVLLENSNCIIRNFDELLPQLQSKMYIEIGFGSGRHLLFQARKNPDVLILGIEIYTPALVQVAKLAKAQGLDNIMLIRNDARLLLSVLQPHSVEKIFLHFPVPWEKKPHRRVISFEFCKECARVLKKDGKFELRTDSFEYFDFSLKQFLKFKNPQFHIQKNHNLDISSKYEDRWKRQKKDIYEMIVWNFCDFEGDLSCNAFDFQGFAMSEKALVNLEKKWSNFVYKGEDFFLHLESLYKAEDALLLKIAFGAFNIPQHSYLLLNKKVDFIFGEPLQIRENVKAMEKLKEILSDF
ncbi:tRNA (guanosine(46)-N7)-methyltransferase TrmB [Campylobacter sp. MIT 21-1685]|uniref:tRNA (guanosine(46)-N7)-methyltransferase TrmB n=1 Tax=unclassified Campylobacter TaxID=2593542 RepID=UPI00224A54E3|nr:MULTISPECIES: tRNA (guanosine(46)-N7)-methyltransferase TrmB [unclassified Campylobacter]MCX2682459.1 tRNA (guanosine(46)-N7)-methyltransferase TrmB [Campylobacter sp. MIT 21-1684]MCX2750828.1 tRNA (guanosine(46)-N7)-methyltransferase TrmB [Campylobacter sp. MIT 21-1682]MCX2806940.1 tRNA (guanosine(46)-N7)-methyltransferase TrmB [Campylobacter sp. MIT 21-1685]